MSSNDGFRKEFLPGCGCMIIWMIIWYNNFVSNSIFLLLGVVIICAINIKIVTSIDEEKANERQREWERDRPIREERERQFNLRMEHFDQERTREEAKKNSEEERRKKIELTAMNKVIAYEKNKGCTPVDVSSQNVGYDIKSSNSNSTLNIEVKGRADDSGYILMTANEWSKAQELENNYYLYVVTNCDRDQYYQHLYIVANPANRLSSSITSDQKHQIELREIKQKS